MSDSSKNPGNSETSLTSTAHQINGDANNHRRLWILAGVGLVILAALLIWGFRCRYLLWGEACHYYEVFTDKETIKAYLKAAGPLAPLLFILIQILQVIFAPIPGEATGFLGGFFFGVPLGFLYSTIGLTTGSLAAFLLGRLLEKKFVERWISKETMARFDFLMEHQGALICFFLFILPGFPKDYLCFILGLSPMPLKLFILMVTVGRIPGTLMLTLQGAKVYQGDWLFTGISFGLCLLLGAAMYYYRETLYEWIKRWEHNRNNKNNQKI